MAGAPCPICEWPTRSDVIAEVDSFIFDCQRCGPYILTRWVQTVILNKLRRDKNARAILSHRLRTGSRVPGAPIRLDTYALEEIPTNGKLPSVTEQSDSLVQ
jgi:hypothetical protein